MHTIYLHIDDDLDAPGLASLGEDMRQVGHITDVQVNAGNPHDMLVEFEEEHISPMAILKELGRRGIHADIMSG